jgi:hypothetical protein
MAISDVASVAGKWSGLLELEGSKDPDEFIELTVDREGSYKATASRTIGLLEAQGKIALADGKLRLQGLKGGTATGTLYAQPSSPDRSLLVEGATQSGRRFSARLKPGS